MRMRKKLINLVIGVICLFQINNIPVQAEEYWPEGPQITGESAIVMEASTGTVLYEKNAHLQSSCKYYKNYDNSFGIGK